MPLKRLLSASVIVATLPSAALAAATWDTELDDLKAMAIAGPHATSVNFYGFPGYATEKKLSLTTFMNYVTGRPANAAVQLEMGKAAAAAFVKADADGDFYLSPDEWKTLMANLRPNHDDRFDAWIDQKAVFPDTFNTEFAAAPKSVTRQQYSDKVFGLTTQGLKAVAQAKSLAAFDKADANDDGKLTREEFKTLLADNNVGGGKDAFKNWVIKLTGDPFPVSVHSDRLGGNTKGVPVDAHDEITENEWIKFVAFTAAPAPGKYDPVKVQKASTFFDRWDADNSGTLSKTEIANAHAKKREADAAAARLVIPAANLHQWAEKGHGLAPPLGGAGTLDANSDSKVSLNEFLTWAKGKDGTEAIVPQIFKAFTAADKNGDAALDGDELKVMLASIASPAPDAGPIAADTSKDPSKSLCFTNDVDYYGHDVHTFIGKGSAAGCQRSCGTVNGANYFQFEPSRNSKPSVCWCKSSRAGEKPHTHRTVGPIFCPGGGLGSGGPDRFVGAWESRTVDKPTNGVAIVGAVIGSGALAMALVMWLAGKRYSGRPQQMEAVPLQVQE